MSWFTERIAERLGQQPQQLPGRAPSYVPPRVAPASAPGYPQPAVPQAYAQPQPQQQQQPQEPQMQLSAYQRLALEVGQQHETNECPECHTNSLYQITTNENGRPLRMLPAPYCTNCGWPNLQAGSIHGGATAVKATGRVKGARQLHDRTVYTYDNRGRIVESFEPQTNAQGGSYV